jgi:hypothetical protein
MKGKLWLILTALSLEVILVGAPVFAQSMPLKANIPFSFTVGDRELAPGDYIVQVISNGQVLQLRSRDGRSAAFALSIATLARSAPKRGTFIFNRYGNQYFLSKVLWPDYGIGRELPQSSRESALARSAERQSVSIQPSDR